MKTKIVVMTLAIILCCSMAQAKEWYEGGTLHNATVKEFLNASYKNALATTSDWVGTTIGEDQVENVDVDMFRAGSEAVYQCIKITGKGKTIADSKAYEIAVMCMAVLKKKFPWMLTLK